MEFLDKNIIYVEDLIEYFSGLNEDDQDERQIKIFIEENILCGLKGNGGDIQYGGDWYPQELISEDYFENYAEELTYELYGNEFRNSNWPFSCIDWEEAAKELKMDYTHIDVKYENCIYTYYYR